MQYRPNITYPEFESSKLLELDELFHRWYITTKQKPLPTGYSAEDLVFDGFYPYYTKQKLKILFVGREARGISGSNYIDVLFNAYKAKKIGNQHLNTNFFAKRMFYISYGIINDFPEWQKIPMADKISETFGTAEGISFSFMNISKFSNDNDLSWKSNWDLINASYQVSTNLEKSLITKQIEILEPDIIISMNLEEKVKTFGEVREVARSHQVTTYLLNTDAKKNILLLDTFHFAAPALNDLNDFYIPITEAIKNVR